MPLPSIACAPGASTLGRHRDDGAVAHMHVADGEVADLVVHRQHMGAAHDELAARRQRSRRRGGLRMRPVGQQTGCGHCRGPGQQGAPVDELLAHDTPLIRRARLTRIASPGQSIRAGQAARQCCPRGCRTPGCKQRGAVDLDQGRHAAFVLAWAATKSEHCHESRGRDDPRRDHDRSGCDRVAGGAADAATPHQRPAGGRHRRAGWSACCRKAISCAGARPSTERQRSRWLEFLMGPGTHGGGIYPFARQQGVRGDDHRCAECRGGRARWKTSSR